MSKKMVYCKIGDCGGKEEKNNDRNAGIDRSIDRDWRDNLFCKLSKR